MCGGFRGGAFLCSSCPPALRRGPCLGGVAGGQWCCVVAQSWSWSTGGSRGVHPAAGAARTAAGRPSEESANGGGEDTSRLRPPGLPFERAAGRPQRTAGAGPTTLTAGMDAGGEGWAGGERQRRGPGTARDASSREPARGRSKRRSRQKGSKTDDRRAETEPPKATAAAASAPLWGRPLGFLRSV
jgi:hypothetical protein